MCEEDEEGPTRVRFRGGRTMIEQTYGAEAEEGQGALVMLVLSFCVILILALVGMIQFRGGTFPPSEGSAARVVDTGGSRS